MADSTVPVVAANTINTVTTGIGVVLFGVHTGLDYATLLAGVLGGATALSYAAPAKLYYRAFEVISAAIIAGYSSPVLGDILTHTLIKFDLINPQVKSLLGLQLGIAFTVAYMAHGVILPGLRKTGLSCIRRYSND